MNMVDIYKAKQIKTLIRKIDFSRLGENVGIKVHFGERGCTTYMSPEIVKAVYDKVVLLGKKAALIETNVLYRGSRTNATDHIATAKEHGFDFAPIVILDGEMGNEFIEVMLDEGVANPVRLGKGIDQFDSLIVLSHFKGHIAAGYGGVFKQLGMGIGSRAGKLHMHASVKPTIDQQTCTGCEICIKNCDFDAIRIIDGKAVIDHDKCIGCAMCIAVCPVGSPKIPWGTSTSEDLQKKIVDYAEGVFQKIPQEKCVFINILEKITKDCDCVGRKQIPLMDDIGILFGYDPVALDKASMDLVMEASDGKFDEINDVDRSVQVEYAAKKGLGSKEYSIVDLE